MRPNLRQLEAFLAVAEAGSFSRAAEQIGMTQPGISQAIREVETLMDLRLFDRTTRRVELTAAGAAFRTGAQNAIAALDTALAEAQDRNALRQGFLRLAAPPFLAARVLPGVLAAFQERHSGLVLELVDTTTAQILARVGSHQADLGLGTFPKGNSELGRRVVLHDEMMCFAKPSFDLPRPMRWTDLADLPIIEQCAKLFRWPVQERLLLAGQDNRGHTAQLGPIRLA